MVDGHYGTVVDGVFTAAGRTYKGYASSGPVFIESLSRGTVVAITLTGKSCWFSVAIASTNALNYNVHQYNNNHHAAFHYSSYCGRVNSDYDMFTRHCVLSRPQRPGHLDHKGTTFTAVLTLRGADRSVSFSVNGVPQDGVWSLPTTDVFYLILATFGGGTIAVTDVSVTMADLA